MMEDAMEPYDANNATFDIRNATTLDGEERPLLGGRYRVVRKLGQGGMGEVYLVEDTLLDGKLFAIKMVPSILFANKRARKQLKDEALMAMKLSHPNIVTLRAFEENNGNPFLVMDYMEGESLDDYLADKGTLTPAETARLLKPVAAALDYAHSKGVVHRDVKPGNIVVTEDGTPYVLDFGIAREVQETLTRVTGKESSGTLLYMGPEQLDGDPPKPAQDIYSFAAMAYECIKGEPPFARGEIKDQIRSKAPEPLAEASPEDAPVVAGIMAGLAKAPEERPETCVAVLEGAAAGVGTAVPVPLPGTDRLILPFDIPAPPVSAELKPHRRGKLKILAAVLAAGLAIAAGVLVSGKRVVNGKRVANEFKSTPVPDSGYKGVQLWEGGPYWAEMNIGANSPEESGLYFWWGDTEGHWPSGDSFTTFDFDDKNCKTSKMNNAELEKYGWLADGVLAPARDAANVKWGEGWRMPTEKEFQDLIDRCDWKWTKKQGVDGYKINGRGSFASESIFLPAAGLGIHTSLIGPNGYYWSSVPSPGGAFARHLSFGSWGREAAAGYVYCLGLPVRPVRGFAK